MSGWRTMDSAPKDGTCVLLGHMHLNHGWVVKAAKFWLDRWYSNGSAVGHPVELWQPLPEPPATKLTPEKIRELNVALGNCEPLSPTTSHPTPETIDTMAQERLGNWYDELHAVGTCEGEC